MTNRLLRAIAAASVITSTGLAQHSQVSAVAVDPSDPTRVWVCNRDNETVSLIDVDARSIIAEIPVGVSPRSLALTPDGSRLFVANQRGNVPLSANHITGYPVGAEFGTVTVIDANTLQITATLTNVGVEPYGIAVDPSGEWFAVSGFRSGTIKFYDAASLAQVQSFEYLDDMNFVPMGFDVSDVDENRDGIADVGEPRGFTIRSDSQRMYVTHNKSPYVSVLDIGLDGGGLPNSVTQVDKIDLNDYDHDTFLDPTPVQILKSQGLPRFLEDIALSPDGSRALVPHLLHNINHDVNHDFGPGFAGAFANRVYPALSVIDAANGSFGAPGDASNRLHHELSDSLAPAGFAAYGPHGTMPTTGNPILIGGTGSPAPGGTADLVVSGFAPGDTVLVAVGSNPIDQTLGNGQHLLVLRRKVFAAPNGTISVPIPANVAEGTILVAQAQVKDAATNDSVLSNGIRFRVSSTPQGLNKMGYRAGHPERARFNASGDHVLMLNRGSEDVFLYSINGSDMELRAAYPPRLGFTERTPLDAGTPMGDLPLGMALVPDAGTENDDALLYVINEGNRTLSSARVDFTTGTIHQLRPQILTVGGPDEFSLSERRGQEIFEDSSRAQTAGNFNNSCASCHFEGGEDSNVWQRPAGPRSTMPVYGGRVGTGLVLWKGVRINMGETGPMFGGENGGHGLFTDEEQQALTDYHERIAIPLNPNRGPNGSLSANARLGQDLFFGTNDTGMNSELRHAGCRECHPQEVLTGSDPGPRFFTADFLPPGLSSTENIANFDPNCFSLRENIAQLNIRNVNTGANIDSDSNGQPDVDRNLDGWDDRETYAVMNRDTADDFQRDDPNSYLCPCDPSTESNCSPTTMTRIFTRAETHFSIPTKLGVFSTGPYFHDHVAFSLRGLLDPFAQMLDPTYGDPAYNLPDTRPGVLKIYNEAHDVRGHEDHVPGASKVQATLNSTNVERDLHAILSFISSL